MTPPTQLADTTAQMKRALIETADELFYTKSFKSVGMDELRNEAGISLKRLYSLFASKEDLVVEVLKYRHYWWMNEIRITVAQRSDSSSSFMALFDYLENWVESDHFHGCVFANAHAELGFESLAVVEASRAFKRDFRRLLGQLAQQEGLPVEVADQLFLLFEGAQVASFMNTSPSPGSDAREAAARVLRSYGLDR